LGFFLRENKKEKRKKEKRKKKRKRKERKTNSSNKELSFTCERITPSED